MQMNAHHPQPVVVYVRNQGNTAATASLICGILAAGFCWIPIVGLIIIPLALISMLLAGLGFILSLLRNGSGLGSSIIGGIAAAGAIFVALTITTAVARPAIDKARAAERERVELVRDGD